MGDDRLYLAPLETEKMTRVLDCGYGICDWAIEMAEMHPDCHVGNTATKFRQRSLEVVFQGPKSDPS